VLGYLNAESSFLRAFGNRSLLLMVLCALTRTGDDAKAGVLGLSLDINPAVIVVIGPVLALLLLISLKVEADTLLLSREVVLEEASKIRHRSISSWVYLLFIVPAAATAFLTLQFILKLVPSDAGCEGWGWIRQFVDFSYPGGTPSKFCIGDVKHTPWIYPPWQTYFFMFCVLCCGYLTYLIARDWPKARGSRG
jgi:hypothetical protein